MGEMRGTSGGAVHGKQAGRAIDAAVTQPGLGRADEPAGHLAAVVAGELADRVVSLRIPRQRRRPGRQVVLARQVEKRRQQRAVLDFRGGDQLREGERFDVRPVAAPGVLQIEIGQGAVGGAQVDADQVTSHDVSNGLERVSEGCRAPIMIRPPPSRTPGEVRLLPVPSANRFAPGLNLTYSSTGKVARKRPLLLLAQSQYPRSPVGQSPR